MSYTITREDGSIVATGLDVYDAADELMSHAGQQWAIWLDAHDSGWNVYTRSDGTDQPWVAATIRSTEAEYDEARLDICLQIVLAPAMPGALRAALTEPT